MNYIQQAFKGKHELSYYVLGLFIILIGWQFIGSIPFIIALILKLAKTGGDFSQLNNTNMLTILEPNFTLFLMLLAFVFGLLALVIVIKYIHKLPFKHVTSLRNKTDWKRVFYAFFLWGAISTSMVIMGYFLEPESYVFNFEVKRFFILLAIAIILIPIQTSFEEYLFRGYLMQGIGILTKSKLIPLILTSVIFGLLHIFNPEVKQLGYFIMVYYIGTGLFLGILTLMDDGLELALGFHAANNLFTALLVTANWTAFQTHSILKDISAPEKAGILEVAVPVFVIFPILLFVFSKKYNWTNWKEKLTGKIEPLQSDDNYKVSD